MLSVHTGSWEGRDSTRMVNLISNNEIFVILPAYRKCLLGHVIDRLECKHKRSIRREAAAATKAMSRTAIKQTCIRLTRL